MHQASHHSRRRVTATLLVFTSALGTPFVAKAQEIRDRDTVITAQWRDAVISGAARTLEEGYFDPAVGHAMADAVRQRAQHGEYAQLRSARILADSLTAHLRAVSHDKHVGVSYSSDAMPVGKGDDPSPELVAAMHRNASLNNHGVMRVERLAGNVGYLKLDAFFDPEEGGESIAAAMALLANTDAMIIDLRENHGGRATMVALLASYFFTGEPVHLNDIWIRDGNSTRQSYTVPYVKGRKYAKPLYLLTSANTVSAGEEFANDMKVLKRATLVGETTAGAANPGGTVSIDEHFGVFVPRGRAINPVTHTNWEGVGVAPDVAVSASAALETAHRRALEAILAAKPDAMLERDARRALAALNQASSATR